jgi:hypothetical protein
MLSGSRVPLGDGPEGVYDEVLTRDDGGRVTSATVRRGFALGPPATPHG